MGNKPYALNPEFASWREFNTAQHSTAQNRTAQHSTAQHETQPQFPAILQPYPVIADQDTVCLDWQYAHSIIYKPSAMVIMNTQHFSFPFPPFSNPPYPTVQPPSSPPKTIHTLLQQLLQLLQLPRRNPPRGPLLPRARHHRMQRTRPRYLPTLGPAATRGPRQGPP